MAGSTTKYTGDLIRKAVRKTYIREMVEFAFLLVLGIAMAGVSIYLLTGKNDVRFVIMALIMGGALSLYTFQGVSTRCKTLMHIDKCKVFRKYGTPEKIAEQLSSEQNEVVSENVSAILTKQFILNKDNMESFVPLSSVLMVYPVQVSRGRLALVVKDCYGDSFFYPFRATIEESHALLAEIKKAAPHTRLGYNRANIAYVKKNRKSV